MHPISLDAVRQAVGGRALSSIRPDETVRAVSTDTRNIEPGSLFVALKGDRYDAHDFLPQAAAGGAVAAIVDRPPAFDLPNMRFIQVDDTRLALGRLASFVRSQLSKCRVIAVAGSNGKTSTKHLISAGLSCKLTGSISPKSYNNDIGVPLTIFSADPMQEYLVLEMGTNHPGEIEKLATMARPDIAVITMCSAEHLEGLGDLMGVRRENAAIVRGLNPRGLLVVNGDDPDLVAAVSGYEGKIVRFGFNPDNDVFATDITCERDGVSFSLNGRRSARFFVPMLGKHNACNALAAIAVARRFNLPEDQVIASLAHSSKPEMRLDLLRQSDFILLNDAYNANPASMRAGIDTLLTLEPASRRVAVIGDMREMGQSSERYHREVGRYLANLREQIDRVYCVGPCSKWVRQEAVAAGYPKAQITHHASSATAARRVVREIQPGDAVLLKGSRSIKLETVAHAITKRITPAELSSRVG